MKSMLLAWFRAVLWLAGAALVAIGLIQAANYFFGAQPVPLPQAGLCLLGGLGTGLAAWFVSRLRPRASFLRAMQLGAGAGIDLSAMAADFGQPVPAAATLEVLLRDLRPTDESGKADFGAAGRLGSFLLLLVIGGLLLVWGGDKLLRQGYRGSGTAFMWALPISLGLAVVEGGFVSLFRLSNRTRDMLIWPVLAALLLLGLLGPWLSETYLGPEFMKYTK